MFNWVSFLTYATITAATPGPNNIMSMSNGSRKGFRRALPFNLGIWAGFSAVTLLCTVFCSLLSLLIPKIQLPMRILGAAYLLYLAWATFRSSGDIQENHILPSFNGQWLPLLGFAMLLSCIGFVFTLCWSAFGALFRGLFARHGKIVNTVMALLLAYCAVSLIVS